MIRFNYSKYKNILKLSILQGGTQLGSLIFLIVTAKFLIVEEFGLLSILIGISAVASSFLTLGYDTAGLRGYTFDRLLFKIYISEFIVGIIISSIIIIIFIYLNIILVNYIDIFIIILYSVSLSIISIICSQWKLSVNPHRIIFYKLYGILVSLVGISTFSLLDLQIKALNIIELSILGNLFTIYFLFKYLFNSNHSFQIDNNNLNDCKLIERLKYMFSNVLSVFFNTSPIFILSLFLGSIFVGYYSFCYKIISGPIWFVFSIQTMGITSQIVKGNNRSSRARIIFNKIWFYIIIQFLACAGIGLSILLLSKISFNFLPYENIPILAVILAVIITCYQFIGQWRGYCLKLFSSGSILLAWDCLRVISLIIPVYFSLVLIKYEIFNFSLYLFADILLSLLIIFYLLKNNLK